jgi:hypothetical protein
VRQLAAMVRAWLIGTYSVMVALGATIHEFACHTSYSRPRNSWMVVPEHDHDDFVVTSAPGTRG